MSTPPDRTTDLGTAAVVGHEAEAAMLPIGTVERETRLAKDTLRIWERRYGFPTPERDATGERLYPRAQVQQLQHIKRLLDGGHRPGAVVGLSLSALQALGVRPMRGQTPRQRADAANAQEADPARSAVLDRLRYHDLQGLHRLLNQSILRLGVERFVYEQAAPLAQAVGTAWASGELQVFEEHLFSEVLEGVLRQAIAGAGSAPQQTPRVLLTTPPDEPHRLGLLMAEAVFVAHGCACMNLGPQTPLHDITLAAQAHRADIVALSLTLAMPVNRALTDLQVLRQALPATVELWVGTAQPALHRREIDGVQRFDQLAAIGAAVARWRSPAARDPAARKDFKPADSAGAGAGS